MSIYEKSDSLLLEKEDFVDFNGNTDKKRYCSKTSKMNSQKKFSFKKPSTTGGVSKPPLQVHTKPSGSKPSVAQSSKPAAPVVQNAPKPPSKDTSDIDHLWDDDDDFDENILIQASQMAEEKLLTCTEADSEALNKFIREDEKRQTNDWKSSNVPKAAPMTQTQFQGKPKFQVS